MFTQYKLTTFETIIKMLQSNISAFISLVWTLFIGMKSLSLDTASSMTGLY